MSKKKKVHFIALGGSVMHALAISLNVSDVYEITGSDDHFFSPSKGLLAENNLLPEKIGFFEENITSEIDMVILGMHTRKDNVELIKAQKMGIPVVSFPAFIYNLSKNKQRIVISGSHGKSTVMSMLIHILMYHNKSFDYVSGASPHVNTPCVKLSEDSPLIIIEGDEYFSSPIDLKPKFFHYAPHMLVVTGISWDHINVFPTEKSYREVFQQLISSIDKGGSLIYNKKDNLLQKIAKAHISNEVTSIPYQPLKSTIVNNITYLEVKEEKIPLEIFGEHNLSNMAAVLEVCLKIGITKNMFYEAIRNFKGAHKRLTVLKLNHKFTSVQNSKTFLDFAHSPSKVSATVKAVKKQYPDHTLNCFLELHTFSSLDANYISNYKNTLNYANTAFVYINQDILRKKGGKTTISTHILKDAFNNKHLDYLTSLGQMAKKIMESQKHDTITLIMSSGDVDTLLVNIGATIPV